MDRFAGPAQDFAATLRGADANVPAGVQSALSQVGRRAHRMKRDQIHHGFACADYRAARPFRRTEADVAGAAANVAFGAGMRFLSRR